jgi:hypothetical protein
VVVCQAGAKQAIAALRRHRRGLQTVEPAMADIAGLTQRVDKGVRREERSKLESTPQVRYWGGLSERGRDIWPIRLRLRERNHACDAHASAHTATAGVQQRYP